MEEATVIPSVETFTAMRSKIDFYEGFFCKRFLKCVVSSKKWNSNHLKHPMCEFVTVTDEAFALLVIMNSHERWSQMWLERDWKIHTPHEEPSWPVPLFTNGGKNARNGHTRRFCGWSNEGVQQFNTLCMMVKENRRNHPDFDEEALERWRATGKGNHSGDLSDKENHPESVAVTPFTDFPWDCGNEGDGDNDGVNRNSSSNGGGDDDSDTEEEEEDEEDEVDHHGHSQKPLLW